MSSAPSGGLTAKDFKSDQQVKWCPGCGDHSALVNLQKVLASLGRTKENTCVVSGIGCSSRFPYYMDTYGFHGIHGRAPAIATGVKCANPQLDVWIIAGDGDLLSIGGNHFMHTIRRNLDLRILLLNNRIYGLTKGQYSPTSPFGARTKSSPVGSIEHPVEPIALAIGAEVSFAARAVDNDVEALQYLFRRAAQHRGTALIEIYQNCEVFNAGAYAMVGDKRSRAENAVYIEHGKPLTFGKEREKGLRVVGDRLEVVLVKDVARDDLLVHDETAEDSALALRLARMRAPEFPVALGVFLARQKPTYDDLLMGQIEKARGKAAPRLDALLNAGETWKVS